VTIPHVLAAMGVPEEWAKGTIRLSTGRMTTRGDVLTAVRAIADAVRVLRSS
jgi:cysteine desulfurase